MYDVRNGNRLSAVSTGAVSITTGSNKLINYEILASGSYLNPGVINVPGVILLDNTFLNGASGGITSANLTTNTTTNYGILINGALTGTSVTINAVNQGGNSTLVLQSPVIATTGDINIVATGTSGWVLTNAIQGCLLYTSDAADE